MSNPTADVQIVPTMAFVMDIAIVLAVVRLIQGFQPAAEDVLQGQVLRSSWWLHFPQVEKVEWIC